MTFATTRHGIGNPKHDKFARRQRAGYPNLALWQQGQRSDGAHVQRVPGSRARSGYDPVTLDAARHGKATA